MASIRRCWILVCFLLFQILTGTSGRRARRETENQDGDQEVSLQDLSSLLGQLPAQGPGGTGVDMNRLMEQAAQGSAGSDISGLMDSLLGQAGQGSTGMGQELGQGLEQALAQSMGQGGGQLLDANTLQQMVNALQQNPGQGVQIPLGDGAGSEGAMMEVFVETKTVDDLLGSEEGRRQLGQLNAQLEQAMNALSGGVNVMQAAQQGAGGQAQGLEGVLSNLLTMLTSEDKSQGDVTAAMTQMMQGLDQLPGLQGALESLGRMLASLEETRPSMARDVQQLMTSVAAALQGMLGAGGTAPGMDSMMMLVQQAFGTIQHNMQLLDWLMRNVDHPAVLQTLNHTHCLMTHASGPQQDPALALQCLQQLLDTLGAADSSGQVAASLTTLLHTLTKDPRLLQSLAAMLQTPSLDSALGLLLSGMQQLQLADGDVASALQTARGMLYSLLQDQALVTAITQLTHSPESATLYRDVMAMLRDATLDSPLMQQVLVVVNDIIVMAWQGADLSQAADTLKQVTAELRQSLDPLDPWGQSQLALLDLFNQVLVMLDQAYHDVNTTAMPPTTTITTTKPDATTTTTTATTTKESTTPVIEVTTEAPTTTSTTTMTSTPTSPAVSPASSARPATTRRSETVDDGDNAGNQLAVSFLSLVVSIFLTKTFL